MKIKLGISPCPNDTFAFYHLLHSDQFNLDLTVEDVEELNQKVLNHELDISKVSFYTAIKVMDHYTLLNSGATLGKNCGPLLVARVGNSVKKLEDAKIAIPGRHTTAHLLFSLYGNNQGEKVFMPFNRIMSAVKEGLVDFGVIIHEGRFTYKDYGLTELADLGKWWEECNRIPLPLGGIVARKEMPEKLIEEFTRALHDSIGKALNEKEDHNSPLYSFVKEYAQEMDGEVIKKHLDLYVNEYSLSLGKEGREAIDKLCDMAKGYNL